MFAPYACNPLNSKGRLVPEIKDPYRSDFHRDRDRIINSASFRRLAYKTQVFVNHEGDHYRTRLTHSLEVSQIARTMSRQLKLCEELAESIALAHDLGHAPFGHAGEDALNEVMQNYGGFDHNAQTLKILTSLEHRYAKFDGLNLTWETLEGVVKHNGPIDTATTATNKKIKKMPIYIKEFNEIFPLELDKYPSLEAQIAAISDDITYNNHDIEDAIRAGILKIEDIMEIRKIYSTIKKVEKENGYLPEQRLIHEVTRVLIKDMLSDVLKATRSKIHDLSIKNIEDVYNAKTMIVDFSEEYSSLNYEIKFMLRGKVYNHYKVNCMTNKARRIVKELFNFFFHDPSCLPTDWQKLIYSDMTPTDKARIVCNFVAGMTDRFAINEYKSFYNL
jgi:dGTPase